MKSLWLMLMLSIYSISIHANERWLIATPNEILNTNGEMIIDVVKPKQVSTWPGTLSIILSNDQKQIQVMLKRVITDEEGRQTYQGKVNTNLNGSLHMELAELDSNRLLMIADSAKAAPATEPPAVVAQKQTDQGAGEDKFERIVVKAPEEDPTITANEPLYFIIGSSDERDFDARFQLSFKYRPFDPDARIAQFIPYASNFYFGYTQTSIWDLGGESSPFKDTSYRPSLYYYWPESGKGVNPSSWKFGVEHESNGRDGDESRSMNIAFVQPLWTLDYSGGKRFTFMPKFYTYLEKADNTDMHHYRGYVDWLFRYGREDAAILTGMYRQGTDGYAQGQLDLSYPISDKLFGRTGTFLHFQLLGGYGETLIDYNKRSDTQLRIGISLAR